MLGVDEIASVVGKSTNSNVTFSTVVEFSTSNVSNVVNGMIGDAIFANVVASSVLSVPISH